MWQCVAECCRVLQYALAVCSSMLQSVCSMLQYVAVRAAVRICVYVARARVCVCASFACVHGPSKRTTRCIALVCESVRPVTLCALLECVPCHFMCLVPQGTSRKLSESRTEARWHTLSAYRDAIQRVRGLFFISRSRWHTLSVSRTRWHTLSALRTRWHTLFASCTRTHTLSTSRTRTQWHTLSAPCTRCDAMQRVCVRVCALCLVRNAESVWESVCESECGWECA